MLVTGATGYIGGRLVPRLLELGYRVRCLVRDPSRLEGRAWQGRVEVVTGDILQPADLATAMRGVEDRIGSCRPARSRDFLAGACCGCSSGANEDAAKGAMALMVGVLWCGKWDLVTRGAS